MAKAVKVQEVCGTTLQLPAKCSVAALHAQLGTFPSCCPCYRHDTWFSM